MSMMRLPGAQAVRTLWHRLAVQDISKIIVTLSAHSKKDNLKLVGDITAKGSDTVRHVRDSFDKLLQNGAE